MGIVVDPTGVTGGETRSQLGTSGAAVPKLYLFFLFFLF
jgi:hypothetical protein